MSEFHLGDKIRQLREGLQISLDDLAEKSQCNRFLLERIETGQMPPSLAPLMNIARALGVRLGTFLDDEVQGGPAVVRKGGADSVVRFCGSSPDDKSELDFYSLGSHKKDRHMEPFLINLHPSCAESQQRSSHEGEEFLYVLKGAVRVVYGKECHVLQEGDSIYYDSIVPHAVCAEGGENARQLAVVYAPW